MHSMQEASQERMLWGLHKTRAFLGLWQWISFRRW